MIATYDGICENCGVYFFYSQGYTQGDKCLPKLFLMLNQVLDKSKIFVP